METFGNILLHVILVLKTLRRFETPERSSLSRLK
jgi:hypothetical protein